MRPDEVQPNGNVPVTYRVVGDSVAGPMVSIIVPVYNGANYLRDAIDSALAQSWANTEVVVVNDGSRDDGATEAIARSYGSRIRYLAKPNGGVASALNAGIAAMRGNVFCWLSHDDRHRPEKTARQVAEWERLGRPDAVLFSDYRLIDAGGQPLADVRIDRALIANKPLYTVLRGNVHGCSVFVPRHLFDVVGTFDEALPTTQDYDLWMRMIRRYPFLHLPEVLVESRWHDAQASKTANNAEEMARFWLSATASVNRGERERLEGSSLRFLRGMEHFLADNALGEVATRVGARADAVLDETLVSVVIPVRDRFVLAASAIESAATQSHPSIEIIVVESGSREDPAVLEAAVARHAPRVRLLRLDHGGSSEARNAGWETARGHYVAFLDADDLVLPGKIATQLRAMEEAGAAFSHTGYYRHTANTPGLTHVPGTPPGGPTMIGNGTIATPTVMVRRSLWDEGFRFPDGMHLGADVVLWLHIAARHGTLGIDEAWSIVRTTATSAAIDTICQREGLANIIATARRIPELASHTDLIDQLTDSLRSITLTDRTHFAIVCQGRSGSTYLQHLLDSHPRITCSWEVFHPGTPYAAGSGRHPLASIAGPMFGETTGVVGFKLPWEHYRTIPEVIEALRILDFRLIHLRRRNKLDHALSVALASHNNVWEPAGPYPQQSVELSPDWLLDKMRTLDAKDEALQALCQGFPHLVVDYEDLLRGEVLDAIQDFLGVERATLGVEFGRARVTPRRAAITNFDELAAHFAGTPWAIFFEDEEHLAEG